MISAFLTIGISVSVITGVAPPLYTIVGNEVIARLTAPLQHTFIFLSKLNISIQLKASIIGALISFGGISVHFQVKSIIDGTKICYKNFLIARIIHAILCFVFIYIFLSWFMY